MVTARICAGAGAPQVTHAHADLRALCRSTLKLLTANPYLQCSMQTAKTKVETYGNRAPKVLKSHPASVLDGFTRTT